MAKYLTFYEKFHYYFYFGIWSKKDFQLVNLALYYFDKMNKNQCVSYPTSSNLSRFDRILDIYYSINKQNEGYLIADDPTEYLINRGKYL